ncbi:MAG: aminotransferase class III-fold pyridoxal phosphate-dependent enzyme, partial [Gammaproteobacteria bacterium SHHR-1]
TGMDRVVFTQSGTEAVMSALRLARAATGRSRIVKFNGAFHGHFDGILIGPSPLPHPELEGVFASRPHFPGTPQAFAEDLIALDYATEQSLQAIDRLGDSLAAVLVEPVQSRNPDLQPRRFLQQLRELTRKHGIALIFDEMVTGFRVHPQGAAGYFAIDCDLATYGKVITGGLGGGCLAGKAEWMEWVNGGNWRFGDASRPSLKTTFIAGTHTQNPAMVAGMHAVLQRLKALGPGFQQGLNRRTEALVERLNGHFAAQAIPLRLVSFGSLFRFRFLGDSAGANAHAYPREMAIFTKLLQHRGLLYNPQGNCFLTAAHDEAAIQRAIAGICAVADELMAVGLFQRQVHGAAGQGAGGHEAGGHAAVGQPAGPLAAAYPAMSLSRAEKPQAPRQAPLSIGQQGLYFEYQIQASQRDLNLPLCLRLNAELDRSRLRQALAQVVQRHAALRSGIVMDGNRPVQRIYAAAEPLIIEESLDAGDETALQHRLQAAQAQPFDLQGDCLLRVHLFSVMPSPAEESLDKAVPSEHYLLLLVPHLLADGYSMQRL